MKTVTLAALKGRTLRKQSESILVTEGGKPIGVFQPLPDPDESIPLSERRKLYRRTSARLARRLGARGITEAQIERDIAARRKNRR